MENSSFQAEFANAQVQVEGSFVAPHGNLVMTVCVDLLGKLLPQIPCLVKVSKPKFNLITANSVRLSRPSVFQQTGKALIRDDQEGHARTSTSNCETIKGSEKEAMDLFNKRVRATNAGLQLGHPTVVTLGTLKRERTQTTTSELKFGADFLIYCTSLWPEAKEKDTWRNTFPREYTSVNKIYRPTQFAQALGMGVCEHIGASGQTTPIKGTFHGFKTFEINRPVQLVLHGSIVYVNNPYQCIQEAKSDWEKICSMIFVKSCKYKAQKEYRFAIASIRPEVGDVFDLPISGMMRDCLVPIHSSRAIYDSFVTVTKDEHKSGKRHETCPNYMYRRRIVHREAGTWKDEDPGSSDDHRVKEKIIEDTITSPEEISEPFPDKVKQPDIIILERFGRHIRFVHEVYREEETKRCLIETLPVNPSIVDNSNPDSLLQGLIIPSENQFKVPDELPTNRRFLLDLALNPSVPMPPMYSERLTRCSQIEMKHALACLHTLNGAVSKVNGEDQERAAASALYAADFIMDLVSWFGPIVKRMCVVREECLAVVEFKHAPLSGFVGWATFSGTGTYTLYVDNGKMKEIIYPFNFSRANHMNFSPYIEILKKYGWPLKK